MEYFHIGNPAISDIASSNIFNSKKVKLPTQPLPESNKEGQID